MKKLQYAAVERERLRRVLQGLLAVAKIAMPDMYFVTDRRVKAAQKLLKEV